MQRRMKCTTIGAPNDHFLGRLTQGSTEGIPQFASQWVLAKAIWAIGPSGTKRYQDQESAGGANTSQRYQPETLVSCSLRTTADVIGTRNARHATDAKMPPSPGLIISPAMANANAHAAARRKKYQNSERRARPFHVRYCAKHALIAALAPILYPCR